MHREFGGENGEGRFRIRVIRSRAVRDEGQGRKIRCPHFANGIEGPFSESRVHFRCGHDIVDVTIHVGGVDGIEARAWPWLLSLVRKVEASIADDL